MRRNSSVRDLLFCMGRLIPWPGCETPSTIFPDRTKSNDDSTDFHPISLKSYGLKQRQQLHKFKWWHQVQERIWSATVQCFEVRRSRKNPIGWSRPGNFPLNVFWAFELVRVWVKHSPLQPGDGYSSNCNVDYCWQLCSIYHQLTLICGSQPNTHHLRATFWRLFRALFLLELFSRCFLAK